MNQSTRSAGRNILTIAAFLLILGGLVIGNLFYTPPEISRSERRRLASRPQIVEDGSLNQDFMTQYEDYTLDSFVFRDGFRRLKALVLYNIFGQKDNNGIYIVDGSAAKAETVDEASVQGAADKINKLSALLEGLNLYYTVIPDKGLYLAESGGYPAIDYDRVEEIMGQTLTGLTYIDIMDALDADAYYKTDLHWDQAKLSGVVEVLGDAMDFSAALPGEAHTLTPFYGVYYGQSALPLPAEGLTYLTGGALEGAAVSILNTTTLEMETAPMYDPEKFTGVDPYDVFLSGAQPLVTIENPNADTDRQLYLFRDSFSSSLAPLLTGAYAKITMIDLRYLASTALDQFVEFAPGSDVLFAYGAQILNSSGVLLVQGST